MGGGRERGGRSSSIGTGYQAIDVFETYIVEGRKRTSEMLRDHLRARPVKGTDFSLSLRIRCGGQCGSVRNAKDGM